MCQTVGFLVNPENVTEYAESSAKSRGAKPIPSKGMRIPLVTRAIAEKFLLKTVRFIISS
jgi:hypothetical protein